MRKTHTSTAVKARWNKKNYDRMGILIPKDRGETIKKYVAENNTSMNGLINELLRVEMGLSESEWKRKTGKMSA